jgi:hypothetical protein
MRQAFEMSRGKELFHADEVVSCHEHFSYCLLCHILIKILLHFICTFTLGPKPCPSSSYQLVFSDLSCYIPEERAQ